MLLAETMAALLMKPLDLSVLKDAADCVFALYMCRPSTFQKVLGGFAQESQNSYIQEAAQKLMQVMLEQHAKQKDKLVSGQFPIGWGSPGLERYPSLNAYRKSFHSFIVQSRNMVLVK
jgi:hypothetical protein